MGLFKADFYKFFSIGFAVGALLMVVTMDGGVATSIADGVVPPAEALPAQ